MRTYEEIKNSIKAGVDKIPQLEKEVLDELDDIKAKLEHMEKGDMRENAGYTELREKQAQANMELLKLSNKKEAFSRMVFEAGYTYVQEGASIKLQDMNNNISYRFIVVPKELGDSLIGALASSTPVGAQIIGLKAGDTVTVQTIEGDIQYHIEEVN